MPHSQWHRIYTSKVAASAELLFGLLSDMPNYDRWLPPSGQFARTTDVEPYPVQLGSRYHDGKPGEPGKDWHGSVTGFQPPGSIDFHHTIQVRQLRAIVPRISSWTLRHTAGSRSMREWSSRRIFLYQARSEISIGLS